MNFKVWYGPWWQHVVDFAKLPNILMIYYEDLMDVILDKS